MAPMRFLDGMEIDLLCNVLCTIKILIEALPCIRTTDLDPQPVLEARGPIFKTS